MWRRRSGAQEEVGGEAIGRWNIRRDIVGLEKGVVQSRRGGGWTEMRIVDQHVILTYEE